MNLSGMTDRDVKFAAELRAETDDQRIQVSHQTFRVFYDLAKSAEEPTP